MPGWVGDFEVEDGDAAAAALGDVVLLVGLAGLLEEEVDGRAVGAVQVELAVVEGVEHEFGSDGVEGGGGGGHGWLRGKAGRKFKVQSSKFKEAGKQTAGPREAV